jgi:hypothetical protein
VDSPLDELATSDVALAEASTQCMRDRFAV